MLESAIQKQITDWLDRENIKWTKSISNTKAGDSDLTLCDSGHYVACEVKVPGKVPTELQTQKLLDVYKSGGLAFYATSLEEFIVHLRRGRSYNCVEEWYDLEKADCVDL